MKKKKRVIPVLEYSIMRESDYKRITDNPVTKKYVYDILLEAIKHAVDNNKNEVELCKIHNTNMSLFVHKNDWKFMLNNAIEFYAADENFEKCQEYKKIINSL